VFAAARALSSVLRLVPVSCGCDINIAEREPVSRRCGCVERIFLPIEESSGWDYTIISPLVIVRLYI
jgi:hypothetical protein